MHWSIVKRILRYLKGTLNHGLFLRKHCPLHLHVFANIDWPDNFDDRTSISGYISFFEANSIGWNSNKQKIITRSTTEAKYHAITTIIVELN